MVLARTQRPLAAVRAWLHRISTCLLKVSLLLKKMSSQRTTSDGSRTVVGER